jgi:hypothetical protein
MLRTLGDSLFPRVSTGDTATVTLLVSPDPPPEEEAGYAWDGRLGGMWFADQVWTFDYPNRRLYFNGTAPTGPTAPKCWVPLGFQTDSASRRTNHFPRITARIDGESIQFLLDTGARTQLTASAWPATEPREPKYRATSFITTDRFEQWRKHHPEWLIVPHAEERADSSAMIRVPTIEIGRQKIGPVWFTERPNRSFSTFMSQYTDQSIEGALGRSGCQLSQTLRFTIDQRYKAPQCGAGGASTCCMARRTKTRGSWAMASRNCDFPASPPVRASTRTAAAAKSGS